MVSQTGINIDSSMLELFRVELENHSKVLESGLVELEEAPSAKKIEPLMRAAHSIKGAARIIGLDAAVTLAHAMEDVLTAAQEGKRELQTEDLDLLLDSNDIFKQAAGKNIEQVAEFFSKNSEKIDTAAENMRKPPEHRASDAKKEASAIVHQKQERDYSERNRPQEAAERDLQAAGRDLQAAGRDLQAAGRENIGGEIEQTDTDALQKDKAASSLTKLSPENKQEDSFVRVLSGNLNKLMGLAGESLVQTKSVREFSGSLLQIKSELSEVNTLKESVLSELGEEEMPDKLKMLFRNATFKLDKIHRLLLSHIESFELFSRRLENVTERLYSEAIATRMKPFSEAVYGSSRAEGFPRMVRDIAKKLGKKVKLEIKGEKTRVDRDILEKLESPLTHLLRNAVDHGIETPEEREAAGKPSHGTLTVEARHSAGMLVITIIDDGKGIDPDKLRKKIIEKDYTSEEIAEKMKTPELMEFLFLPGFSTAGQVTEISGRGVGLDVVFSMVHEVGGTIRAESEPGEGTAFLLNLPLTLSVMPSLLAEIDSEIYGFPLSRIDRVLKIKKDEIKILEDRQYASVDGESIGIVDAMQVFGMHKTSIDKDFYSVIVLSDRFGQNTQPAGRYGLVVGRVIGGKNLVVIPLDKKLGKINNISAGAILENGSPVLIVDVDDAARNIDKILSGRKIDKIGGSEEKTKSRKKRILVVDDSLTVREVERKLLENKGYKVETAVDGMDGWNTLNRAKFDLIISDIDMPRMNGFDFVTRVKNNNTYKDLPVMIVSYKDREEDKIRGLEAGANYYLTKSSFHDDSLIEAVIDLIGEA